MKEKIQTRMPHKHRWKYYKQTTSKSSPTAYVKGNSS